MKIKYISRAKTVFILIRLCNTTGVDPNIMCPQGYTWVIFRIQWGLWKGWDEMTNLLADHGSWAFQSFLLSNCWISFSPLVSHSQLSRHLSPTWSTFFPSWGEAPAIRAVVVVSVYVASLSMWECSGLTSVEERSFFENLMRILWEFYEN